MTATTTKNSKPEAQHVSVEQGISDLQAAGEARYAEVAESVRSHLSTINTARHEIVGLIRTIKNESLWVFGRNAEGETYSDWKSAVKDLLGSGLSDWSKSARNSFVVMLVDEGFTPEQAAEVTGSKPSEAKKAVTEANAEAAGESTEAQAPTPPVELSKEAKAKKIADQVIAQNKRGADVIFDMDVDTLKAVEISLRGFHTSVVELIKHRVAEAAGTENAA